MREKFKQLKPIQNMMVLALLALLFVLTTQTSAIGQILCDGRVPTIVGTEANDKLIGTDGPDVIHGLGGFDIIWGMGGDDVICGGDGTDNLSGRDGNDIIFGENGYDSIWGGIGNDVIHGGDGNDSISGGPGNDELRGDNGNDNLYGRSGVDELYGGEGTENNDSCYDEAGTFIMGCEQFNGDYIPPTPVPKTGQTSCWDQHGGPIDCEGTGQDGELQKGVAGPEPRFTDNGDGTVTDHLTDLIWLQNADCLGDMNWDGALETSNNLADGQCALSDGSNPGDWRLPNIREFMTLIDFQYYAPALPSGHPFVGEAFEHAYGFWSSTSVVDGEYAAWTIYIIDGNLHQWEKWHHYPHEADQRVWPVRGGNNR